MFSLFTKITNSFAYIFAYIKLVAVLIMSFVKGFILGSYNGSKAEWDMVYWALFLVGIPLILLYLGVLYYRTYAGNDYQTEGMTSPNGEKKDVEILFFFADWCPHCTKAKPIIRDIKAKFDGRTINNKTITFKDIDCTVETQDTKRFIEKYNVESFPTIIIQTGDDTVKYDGKVEQGEFTKFIEQNIQ